MPLLAKRGNTYIGALQCGAGHDAYLEFELAKNVSDTDEPDMYTKDPIKYGLSEGVDPQKIYEAALLGVRRANEKFGTNYKLKRIGYVPNDSVHYDLHARVTFIILQHIHEGGKFKVSNEKG